MNPATKLPETVNTIHFIGIGGIGMSGIAEVLLNMGHSVQGSDIASSVLIQRLEGLGAKVFLGQSADNLGDSSVVVVSSAISHDNPELVRAREIGLPVVRRAEMLAELMRLRYSVAIAGTHGKTTTTTLVATLMEKGGFDPTVINGGIIHAYGSNARKGEGDWMVVEADESDGTFLKLPATIAVVTNIDPEHMDHYRTFDNLRQAFQSFVSSVPFYGYAVCGTDHPEVQALVNRITDRRIITYGYNEKADVQVRYQGFMNGHSSFAVKFNMDDGKWHAFELPMAGEHNVLNAVAAITVVRTLGLPLDRIAGALKEFEGVNRRFTRVGVIDGIEIIDDYGHHPVEIKAVLRAARQQTQGRIFAVHQPHRFTRLHDLFDDFCRCFDDADFVGITDVYAAGESRINGSDKESLVRGLVRQGHPNAAPIEDLDNLAALISKNAVEGDMVVCLGAGTITQWAYQLPQVMASMR